MSFEDRGADLVVAIGAASNVASADARGKPQTNAVVVKLVLAAQRGNHVTLAEILEAHRARLRLVAVLA